jgi:HSP20 family protein
MSITRWDPWGEMMSLREAMDSLLQESVVRPQGMGQAERRMGLSLDVEDRGDDFVVTAPIPGIKPENVEISVLGDTLRIHAERRDERREEGEGQRWLLREQRYGSFERMITLPSAIKSDQASAEFRDGVLTITLPKAEEAKERRIPVRAGEQAQEVPIEAEAKSKSGNRQS